MHVQERPGISSDHVAAAEALASSQCSTRSPSSSVWKRSTAALRSSHCEARSATVENIGKLSVENSTRAAGFIADTFYLLNKLTFAKCTKVHLAK